LRFCDGCGSFMEQTAQGYKCTKCGHEVKIDVIEYRTGTESTAEPVYVVKKEDVEAIKVAQICPKCGSNEAFRQVTVSLGEHAGVKNDRYVEKFKCSACGHTWVKN